MTQTMEERTKNNINWQIAARLNEIWKNKWEKVYMYDYDPNSFWYQGRKFKVWLKVVWSKVWDIPDNSDYIFIVNLWDLAVCNDYYNVITEMQAEKWINIEISDFITLDDCIEIWGWEYESLKEAIKTIEESWLKNKEILNEIFEWIWKDLRNQLSQYSIAIKNWKIYLKARNSTLQHNIINKDKVFLDDMNIIKAYFDKELPEIKSKIDAARYEEKRKDEEIKEKQEKKAKDLQDQL